MYRYISVFRFYCKCLVVNSCIMSDFPLQQRQRSQHSQNPAFAKFVNKTDRNVSVEWLNFQGNHVVYKDRLEPRDYILMDTFKTHPWVFYESICRHPLTFLPNFEKIYFPVEWSGEHQRFHSVEIVNPLLNLRQICLNYLHRYLVVNCEYTSIATFDSKVDQLFDGLPVVLANDLKQLSKDQDNKNLPIYFEGD